MILVLEDDNNAGRVIQNAKFPRGEMNNVIRVKRGKKETLINGAVFPEKLVAKLINAFSNENDLVYDPFMGSGTTAVVCEKLNRKWIGSELIKEQHKQSEKRLEPLLHNLFT
jgi:site-specific DNA-methyltransferase (adenine-specific)/modification methylase